jgi:hypothetical protein
MSGMPRVYRKTDAKNKQWSSSKNCQRDAAEDEEADADAEEEEYEEEEELVGFGVSTDCLGLAFGFA